MTVIALEWLVRLAAAAGTVALIAALAWSVITPAIVLWLYRKHLPTNRLQRVGAAGGAGSADLHYHVCVYDVRGDDLVLEGRPPEAPYWSVGLSDTRMLAIAGAHLNHREIAVDDDGCFRIRLTRHYRGEPNTLDCRRWRQGLLMFRVVPPWDHVETPALHPTEKRPGVLAAAAEGNEC